MVEGRTITQVPVNSASVQLLRGTREALMSTLRKINVPRTILHLLFAAFAFALRAQTTFNVVQQEPSNQWYLGACSVFERPDGYLVFSNDMGTDSTVSAVQITKCDLEGSLQWQVEHSRERSVTTGGIDPIAEIEGGRYVAALSEYSGTAPRVTYLYWFDANGDTLRTRFLKSDSSAAQGSHGTQQLIPLADGGFLHCGRCAGYPLGAGGCITRLDSTGTILWERIYPQHTSILHATELVDGGFVLGGLRNSDTDMALVIRTDSAGIVQWTRFHGLYSVAGGKQALVTADGSVLMAGSWNPDPFWSAYDRWSSLYKYDPNGTLETRKDYFYSYNAEARFILPKANDHYWLVGGMFQYFFDPDGVMTLWELDENLDPLWMRRYWYYAPDDAESSVNSVRSTADGGLVMCGVARQGNTDPLPYRSSNWLIKLDAFGCLVPGCQSVGVQEFALGVNQYLHVAPNPVAQGQPVQLRFEPPQNFSAKGPLQVTVLDATGRMVQQERLVASAPAASATLALTLPASGLYYLHLADNTRWLAGAKVVVE